MSMGKWELRRELYRRGVESTDRIDERDLGEPAPWIVEEPEDWRTRTSDDSRRLRRACARMMVVYAAGLLVGFVLVRLVGMIG